jgi:predicted alpha/beta superfamily hydrolase
MKTLYFYYSLILVLFVSCTKNTPPTDPIPEHETLTITSKHVGEDRIINVWTPADYASQTDSLPVMYMADGGITEDFPHIANTLEKLVGEGKIKPLILVGIENTQRRRDLTGPTEVASDKEIAPVVGGSAKFRAFIKEELIPEINHRYRTTSEKSLIGESASGLFVMETLLLEPELFDNYIAFDPSLWWNNHYLVRTSTEHLSHLPDSPKRLWFAGSDTEGIAEHTKKLAEILKITATPTLTWTYSDEPTEKHNTIFRATKEKAIIWTLNSDK